MMPMMRAMCVSLAAVLGLAAWGQAAINPDFTPVHLIAASTTILELKVGAVPAQGPLLAKVVQARKGGGAGEVSFELAGLDAAARDQLSAAVGSEQAPAVYFAGDFSKAAMRAAVGGAGAKTVGAMLIGGKYFGVFEGKDGKLSLGPDGLDLRTVWAGTAEMFLMCMEYLASDPSATVPVASGARWEREVMIGKVAGKVSAALAVELRPGAGPDLVLASDAGDRIFRRDAAGAWADITASAKLNTRSTFLAAGDFDGDGRLDLALGTPAGVSVATQREDGAFAVVELKLPAGTRVTSLSALAIVGSKKTVLLVGTPGIPLLAKAAADGTFAFSPLVGSAAPALGEGGFCAAADFDSDGLVDVLQVFARGAVLYRGAKDGSFVATSATGGRLVGGVTSAAIGDFDADGKLDAMLAGSAGTALLRNRGDGTFVEQVVDSGEIGYDDKLEAVAAVAVDVNNDGRQDLLLAFADKTPFVFFNRGFCTFGVANDLLVDSRGSHDAESAQLKSAADLREGQQALAAADFDGDGVQDMVCVAKGGQVWLLATAPGPTARVGLTVAVGRGMNQPLSVRAFDGKRALGARIARAGEPAFFAKANRGPVRLEWTDSAGAAASRTVVLREKMRVELGEAK